MQRISSGFTDVYRYVLPFVFLLSFGVATFVMFFASDVESAPSLLWIRWVFLLVWFIAAGTLFYFFRDLQHVWEDGDKLVIKRQGSLQGIPLSWVTDVRAGRWSNPPIMRVRFQTPDGLQHELRFVAPTRWFAAPFSEHPLAAELRARASASPAPAL